MNATHTYALLYISASAYEEIRAKLTAAGYDDQFHLSRRNLLVPVIDMHGIAVLPEDGIEEE